jgi:molybdate transport system permease protein
VISAAEVQILTTSFSVALWAVACSLPLAVACAFFLSRRFPGKLALDGLVHLPIILPPVLIGFILLALLGRRGPIGAWLEQAMGIHLAFTREGAALATAVMIFPVFVRSIRLSFESADRNLFEAAAMLRAGPLDRFVSIALPLAGPGILAGAVMAFATALGEFGAVITFAANIPGQHRRFRWRSMRCCSSRAVKQRPCGWRRCPSLAMLGLAAAAVLQRWAARRLAG